MRVVVDTNVLVSAMWSKDGIPAKVVETILTGKNIPCYDHRIIEEYFHVLKREKFGFSRNDITALLDWIMYNGISVISEPCNDRFTDEADKKFLEVARAAKAYLITGNLRHFPQDPTILSPKEFLMLFD